MAALTSTVPVVTGTTTTGAAVSASDTVDASILGQRGAYFEVINAGGSSDTVTIKDFSFTDAGNQLPSQQYTVSVANGTSKVIHLKPFQVDPTTGLITITHSFTTSVTYKLYPVQ